MSLFSLHERSPLQQWLALLGLTILLTAVFEVCRLPAALLLGAMFAAILIASGGAVLRTPGFSFPAAQGLIGVMVAQTLTPPILVSLRADWLLFVSVTLVVIAVCSGMSVLLARQGILPGTTAVWGCSPGGASVMTVMSEDYGGDIRLVAVMQYLRVVLVAILATVVSRIWIDVGNLAPPKIIWFPPLVPTALAATLSIALGGAWLAQRFRLPGGALLLPLALGAVLQGSGALSISLPPWILAMAYALLGWSIGLRFTRSTLHQAARALPAILISIICLLLLCGGVAVALHQLTGVDPLTAYLATSPGGLDTVAIIAAASGVNLPFVMAFQTARVLMVIMSGPMIARALARRLALPYAAHD